MYPINRKYLNCLQEKSLKNKIRLKDSQIILLKFLATGQTLTQISINLNTTQNNIKKRTQNLYKKFGVNNRKDLIQHVLKEKIITNRDISNKFRRRFVKLHDKIIVSAFDVEKNHITDSELKLLYCLALGFTKPGIINEFQFYNMYQCNYELSYLFEKLNVKNRIQAVTVGIKSGLINI